MATDPYMERFLDLAQYGAPAVCRAIGFAVLMKIQPYSKLASAVRTATDAPGWLSTASDDPTPYRQLLGPLCRWKSVWLAHACIRSDLPVTEVTTHLTVSAHLVHLIEERAFLFCLRQIQVIITSQ